MINNDLHANWNIQTETSLRHSLMYLSGTPEPGGGGLGSGLTEQCGALSRSRGLGPLFFCKSSLQVEPEITLTCIKFSHDFKQY